MINDLWNKLFRIIILTLTIINIFIIGFSIATWIGSVLYNLIPGTDFSYFYTAYAIVRSDDVGKLYDLQTQAAYQHEILGLRPNDGFLPFLYPPSVALFLSILTALPLNTAYYLWSLIQLGLLIWLIFLLNHIFVDWNKQEHIILSLTIFAFWPLAITLILGQFSLIILLCLSQLYLALKNNKTVKAGFWLSLLMIKPLTILLPGAITINKRYWRVAITAVVFFFIVVLFSAIFLGPKTWIDYARLLPTMSSYYGEYGFHPNVEYSLKGMLSSILGYYQGNLVSSISIITLSLGIVFMWYLWLPDIPTNGPRFKILFALMSILSVFLSLHLYPHDSLILVLPAALLYDYLRQKNYQRKLYSLLILSSPLVFFIAAFNQSNIFGVIRPPIIVIIIMLICMVYYMALDIRENFLLKNYLP